MAAGGVKGYTETIGSHRFCLLIKDKNGFLVGRAAPVHATDWIRSVHDPLHSPSVSLSLLSLLQKKVI